MKKIFILIFLLSSLFYFSQQSSDNETENIVETADKLPVFEGGINVFRKIVAERFNIKNVDCSKGIHKSITKFVIERDGTIGPITVKGDCKSLNDEVERVIRTVETKWQPAVYKGILVRSYFSLPLNINFN